MRISVTKNEYIHHLFDLAKAMHSALNRADFDMAAQIYDERSRYMADHQPDRSECAEEMLDSLLKLDQELIQLMQNRRQSIVASGSRLQKVQRYSGGIYPPPKGGDWGSG
jgi:hypothetical protein